jgi:hypothetical protein
MSEKQYRVEVPGCPEMTLHYILLQHATDARDELDRIGYSSVCVMVGDSKLDSVTGFGMGNYKEYE